MNNPGKCFIILVLCLTLIIVNSTRISAQTRSSNLVSENLPPLKRIGTEINKNVLALLALIKEYEKNGPATTYKVARVLKPVSPVKETDNINSRTIVEVRQSDEFGIIDEHDKWYKIRTLDNREGWISEVDIQILKKQSPGTSINGQGASKHETAILLDQMTRFKNSIDELHSSAVIIIKKIEEEHNNLSDEKRKLVETDYQSFIGIKGKIEKYYSYATRFINPYESLLTTPDASKSDKSSSGERFKGTVSADVGKSSYQNMNSNSTTSTRLGLNGIYQIDKSASVNVGFSHQKELIQTAFTSNTFEAGFTKQFEDKLTFGSNFGYDNYNDKASDNNSFGHFSAGVNTVYTPSRNAKVFGNINYQSKNFKSSGDENYQGILYAFGTNLMLNSRNSFRFQIQGNKESSEKDFLNFSQVSPQFSYLLKKSTEKTFNVGLEYDLLKFALTNNYSDSKKYEADFQWRKNLKKITKSTDINLTYKQFPNNSKQDYLRLGSVFETRKGSYADERSSISSVSYLFTVITEREDNFLTDYLDIRWDKSKIRPKSYSITNIYVRLWNNFKRMPGDSITAPDHFIDFYGELGPSFRKKSDSNVTITSLKIGFVFGGHMFFNFDSDYFIRNGNSVRGGLTISSNLKIYKANLVLSGSYERSIILCKKTTYNPNSGNIKYGDNLFRKPSSVQFNIDYRQPVAASWDIHFNLSTYGIRTDATTESGINPIDKKSNLRFSGGLVYRFAL
jgi:hypothetical protein